MNGIFKAFIVVKHLINLGFAINFLVSTPRQILLRKELSFRKKKNCDNTVQYDN